MSESKETCILDILRKVCPFGDFRFYELVLEEAILHSEKNHDYASGGHPLGNFNRVATILGLYPKLRLSDPEVVALVYLLKQFDAVLWGLSERIEHRVEGFSPRLRDISVYSKIIDLLVRDRLSEAKQ